jgi:hypothetical protein
LLVDLNTSIWWICGIMWLRGAAYGAVFIPVQVATYATVSSAATGRASSLFSTNRQVAQSIGVAIAVTLLVSRSKSLIAAAHGIATQHAAVFAYHDAYAATMVLALLGVVFALLIHDEDAAATMARSSPAAAEPVAALG